MPFLRIILWLVASAGVALAAEYPRQFGAEATERQLQAQTQTPAPALRPQEGFSDVPYVPTPDAVVEEMLKQALVTGDNLLYDLGSGCSVKSRKCSKSRCG